MLTLPLVEFHITNTCNFNCTGCNRFNNYIFVGQQRWQDYADVYRQWSDILKIENFSILGGEPMLNSTYLNWLDGITELWPDAIGKFTTNGHYLRANNYRLYESINKSQGRVTLEIGLHNHTRQQPILETVESWLKGKITIEPLYSDIAKIPGVKENWKQSYDKISDPSWPRCDSIDDWYTLPEYIQKECSQQHNFDPDILNKNHNGYKLTDSNGVKVIVANENFFSQSAVIDNLDGTFGLHNSNPLLAHKTCSIKHCHQFIKGKLYKCAPVALFNEFDQQFNLELSAADRNLMRSYSPADLSWDYERIKLFVNGINEFLPQCKFCPEVYNSKIINAEHNKKSQAIRKKV